MLACRISSDGLKRARVLFGEVGNNNICHQQRSAMQCKRAEKTLNLSGIAGSVHTPASDLCKCGQRSF